MRRAKGHLVYMRLADWRFYRPVHMSVAEERAPRKPRGNGFRWVWGLLAGSLETGERALVQNARKDTCLGVLPDSRAVLCIPITYGETRWEC